MTCLRPRSAHERTLRLYRAFVYLHIAHTQIQGKGGQLVRTCRKTLRESPALKRGLKANKALKGFKPFSKPFDWMEAKDQCDPGTLRLTPEPCIKKMLDVLSSYKSFVSFLAELKSCPVAAEVVPVLRQLHKDMSSCVRSRTEYHPHHKVDHINFKSTEFWKEGLLCDYTMERLFSFSILTARVFSVGDPVNHAAPTEPADSPKCTLQN
ncbi:hypothetical protein WMY93_027530 [Mugilogobius chulae]|uniref:Uncharacterized protein n=1 Tax=Mugilogobius chulae TaxID=88201 RepID=A0AAW0MXJ7_9GOBI